MTKTSLLSFGFMSCILLILFNVVGCSDPTHTGSITTYINPMLTPDDIDEYLITTTGGAFCIYNDWDSTCRNLIPLTGIGVNANGPIIHIYPEKLLYVFYHEGKPIAEVEKIGDTTGIKDKWIPDIGDDGDGDPGDGSDDGNNPGTNNRPNGDGPGDNNNPTGNPNPNNPTGNTNPNDGHGWIIWIYYPKGTILGTPSRLSDSQVTVTINGLVLTDADITGFAYFTTPENERGIQFFYPTESAELLDLRIQMTGITGIEGTAKFNINYLWESD